MYVPQDPTTGKITDFISFYSLPSLIMKHPTHKSLETAYAFYYATDVIGFPSAEAGNGSGRDSAEEKEVLGQRLNALMKDCLIVAKQVGRRYLFLVAAFADRSVCPGRPGSMCSTRCR